MLYKDVIDRDMETGRQKSIDLMKVVIFIFLVPYYTPVT